MQMSHTHSAILSWSLSTFGTLSVTEITLYIAHKLCRVVGITLTQNHGGSLTSGVIRCTVLYRPQGVKVTRVPLVSPINANEKIFGFETCIRT